MFPSQSQLHHAKVKQTANADPGDDLIILNPNWLTTTIFGPIFAKPDFREDYRGVQEKQEYNLSDLKASFQGIQDSRLLVDLLEHFELAYR